MLNSIGLENPGIEVFLRDYLPGLNSRGVVVLANIAGNSVEEYARMASLINDSTGVAGIEMNISCPNVKQGGLQFGTDPDMVYQVVKAVREQTTLPVIPKLSPNVSDIVAIARAAQAAGADALSMINTLMGMAVDIKNRRPVLGNIFGGLSGPAIKPVALRMVYQVYKEVDLPILAGGGIINGNDALEFIMVGATAVSIGTGIFLNPFLGRDIVQGILRYMKENGLKNLEQIRGVAVD
jgi:dihydroorotate oxidase B, catalytic subunit (EC 1.3.3.1)